VSERESAEHLPLHPLELRILLAVLEGPAHAYRIVKAVEAAEGHRFKLYPANLYRRIRDLAAKGLLEEVDPPAGDDAEERPRTFFSATALGRRVAHAETARLEELLRNARAVLRRA
jgi:DNA-binding PadR family transcriptional regulator